MSSKIQELKNTLGIGARSNKYRIIINQMEFSENVDILCKSSSLPGKSFADIEIYNRGRKLNFAGQAQFDGNWSCTFIDDENHSIRKLFINWMNYIDSTKNHSRKAVSINSYMKTAIIQQLSTITNKVTAEYIFNDLYPKSISESTYSDDSSELIEFNIEFSFSFWENTK